MKVIKGFFKAILKGVAKLGKGLLKVVAGVLKLGLSIVAITISLAVGTVLLTIAGVGVVVVVLCAIPVGLFYGLKKIPLSRLKSSLKKYFSDKGVVVKGPWKASVDPAH